MRPRLLAALALACTAAPLAAQDRIDSGSVVRVKPGAGARWHTGRLRGIAGDTLWVASLGAPPGREGRALVAPRESAQVEVSSNYDAISSRRHRVIAGSAIVLALLSAQGASGESRNDLDVSPLAGGIAGFGFGLVVGVVAAEVAYPRRWDPVRR